MRLGRHTKPTITTESVQTALKLVQSPTDSVHTAQPLTQLALIDKFLATSARPSAENLREWALHHVLVDMINNQYQILLSRFEITLPQNTTRSIIQEHLTTVFQQPSDVLKGWCLLVYRFVHAEYGFLMEELAQITSTHQRTLRRYTKTATLELRDYLIEQEWAVRVQQQKRLLKSQIPVMPHNLIGRQPELNHALTYLTSDTTQPVFITGVSGIGKTAFVASVTQQLIDDELVDFVVWVDAPDSISEVVNRIWDVVAPHATTGHWQDYVFSNRLLVVIDNSQSVVNNTSWQTFSSDMAPHLLICIQNTSPSLVGSSTFIPLDALAFTDVQQLLSNTPIQKAMDYNAIFEQVGGNPRLLLAVAYALGRGVENIHQISSDEAVLAHALESDFNQLSDEQRYIWWKLAVLPHGIDISSLDEKNNQALKVCGSVVQDDGEIRLATPLHLQYAIQRYSEDAILRRNVHARVLNELRSNQPQSDFRATYQNTFILHLLQCAWLQLDTQTTIEVAKSINNQQMTAGQLREWRSAVEYLIDFDNIHSEYVDLYPMYINAVRRLRDPHSIYFITKFVAYCGREGAFDMLLETEYERGVLFQAKGAFEEALRIYDHLHTLLERYPNNALETQIWVQQIRLAIARHESQHALDYLEKCDEQTQEIQALRCEALYQQGMHQRCLNLINHYLTQPDLKLHIQSAFHTIAGRIFQAWQDANSALNHLNTALILSERNGDTLDTCRAHTNLISAQLYVHDDISAQEMEQLVDELTRIRKQQALIRDYVGLEATQRTLKYVQSL